MRNVGYIVLACVVLGMAMMLVRAPATPSGRVRSSGVYSLVDAARGPCESEQELAFPQQYYWVQVAADQLAVSPCSSQADCRAATRPIDTLTATPGRSELVSFAARLQRVGGAYVAVQASATTVPTEGAVLCQAVEHKVVADFDEQGALHLDRSLARSAQVTREDCLDAPTICAQRLRLVLQPADP